MSKSFEDLDPRFRPLAEQLFRVCSERGNPLTVIDTLRTAEEQTANLIKGVSWTKRSLHLPQPPHGLAWAIDFVPTRVLDRVREAMKHAPSKDARQWFPSDPLWTEMGELGESLGLTWGGRWKKRDMLHFEKRFTVTKVA